MVLIVAVILLLPVLVILMAWPMVGMWGGGHMWDGATGVGWVTMLFAWLVPLAVVLGVGYLLYRALVGSSGRESDRALEELRVAYACGEISDEEFEQRRERLQRER